MGSKTRLSAYCTKQGNNGVNLVTSRKMNTRLARPIGGAVPEKVIKQYLIGHIDTIVMLNQQAQHHLIGSNKLLNRKLN